MKKTFKNILSFFLRFGVSVVLLVWLFSKIDLATMWTTMRGMDAGYLVAAGLVFVALNFIILGRWMVFMEAMALHLPLGSVIRWFFIGLFCNLFLPTAIGGDVIKAIGLSRVSHNKPKVFASIVVDRLSGFAGIALVALVAFVTGFKWVNDTAIIASVIGMTVLSVGASLVLLHEPLYAFATKIFSPWPKVVKALMEVHYDIALLKARPAMGLLGIGISCVNQTILAVMFYLIAMGLHQEIPFIYFLIFSPMVCVTATLPSIGGLGVREIGWAYCFAKVGFPQAEAVSMSLISFFFMIVIGVAGGVLYVLTLSSGRVQHHSKNAGA